MLSPRQATVTGWPESSFPRTIGSSARFTCWETSGNGLGVQQRIGWRVHNPSPSWSDENRIQGAWYRGVFFKAKNPFKVGAWYQQKLDLSVDPAWDGCSFEWSERKAPHRPATTVWSPFPA